MDLWCFFRSRELAGFGGCSFPLMSITSPWAHGHHQKSLGTYMYQGPLKGCPIIAPLEVSRGVHSNHPWLRGPWYMSIFVVFFLLLFECAADEEYTLTTTSNGKQGLTTQKKTKKQETQNHSQRKLARTSELLRCQKTKPSSSGEYVFREHHKSKNFTSDS